jgi:hypothetical protein
VCAATQLDQRELHVIAKHLAFVRDQLLKPVVTTLLLRRAALSGTQDDQLHARTQARVTVFRSEIHQKIHIQQSGVQVLRDARYRRLFQSNSIGGRLSSYYQYVRDTVFVI